MTQEKPSILTDIDLIKDFYAALNRNDISSAATAFDPRIEWIDPVDPTVGTYRGKAAVMAHFAQARETWAEGSCEPVRLIGSGDKVVVFVNVRVRLKNEADWREGELGDVFTFCEGKIIHVRSFADRQQALAWAGIEHHGAEQQYV